MTTRLSKPELYMRIAEAVAQGSTCSRSKVGAVLVAPDELSVAFGYNGSPAGEPHCIDGACPRGQLTYEQLPPGGGNGYVNCIAVHAEANAVLRADTHTKKDGSLYVTREPCHGCERLIKGAGVSDVHWREAKTGRILTRRWNA
ncbi:deoxycytidylate deaminase [Streptomyces cacaoi]|uniref:Cytidine deaminase n=1 Tax=Streptomyces cacaoi TaxID=1898 RepID=A0A4Y3R0U6_STRCI|nr:deaminase [Streptomyces cacaoi]GEB50393.1 cytidine deaminase [Streptomyces cacaoi]